MTAPRWTILLVGPDAHERDEARRLLLAGAQRPCRFVEAPGAAAAPLEGVDCVILRPGASGEGAAEAVATLRAHEPAPPVVVLTGDAGRAQASGLLRAGAAECIGRSWLCPESLARAVESAVEREGLRRELNECRERARGAALSSRDSAGPTEGEQRLRLAFEAAQSVIYDWRIADDRTTRSADLSEILVDPSAAGASAWYRLRLHPGDAEGVAARLREAVRSGADRFEDEYRLVRRDGSEVWVHDRGVFVRDEHGRVVRCVGSLTNIEARRRAEAGLRENEEILRGFYDSSPFMMGVVELDGDTIVAVHGNPMVAAFMGVRPEELPGRDARTLSPSDAVTALWRDRYRQSRDSGGPVRFEYEHPAPGGAVWLSATVCHLGPGPSGRPRFSFIAEDVTERKRVEERIRGSESALRRSSERLAMAQDAAGLGIHDFDVATGAIDWDARARALWGVGPDEPITYELFMGGVHPDDRAATQRAVDTALDPAGDGMYRAEFRVIGRDDGVERWVAATGKTVFEGGRAVRLVGTAQDVTARRRAEEAARESEERLRRATTGGHVGLWDWKADTGRTVWSDVMWRIYGRTPDPAVNAEEVFRASLHPDDRGRVLARIDVVLRDPASPEFNEEFRIVRPDGSLRWVQSIARPQRGPGGVLAGMSGVNIDITARKEAERALSVAAADLARERERLNAALRTGRLGAYEWTVQTGEVWWSPESYAIFGLDPASFVPTRDSFASLIHPDDREDLWRKTARSLERAEPFSHEYRTLLPGGGVRWVANTSSVRLDAQGRPERVTGVVADITERKEAELARHEAAARDAYRVKLGDALRPLSDPLEIQAAATRLLREELGAARTAYFEVRGSDYVIERDCVEGVPSMAGRHPVASFGPRIIEDLRAGRPTRSVDIEADPVFSPAEREAFAALHIRAYIGVPLVKGGELVGGLAAQCSAPRRWTEADMALLEETAERIWADIERARAENAMRESEQRLRLFIEHAPAAVAMFDRSMRYMAVSARWLATFGLSDVLGRSHYDLFPDLPDRWKQVHRRVLAGNVERCDEDRFDRADGSTSWFRWECRPWHDASNQIGGLVIFTEDITARKQTEASLRLAHDRELFYFSLGERLRGLSDPEQIQHEAAAALARHLGAARAGYAEDLGDGEHAAVLHDFVDGVPSIKGVYRYLDFGPGLLPAFSAGQNVILPDIARDPTLTEVGRASHAALKVGASANVPLIKNGTLVAVMFVHFTGPHAWTPEEAAVIEAVAERTWSAVTRARAEARLRAAHDAFRSLVENSPFGIYAVDADFRLVQVSAGARKVFENVRPLVGRDFAEVMRTIWSEPTAEEFIARFRHTLQTGEPYRSPATVERRADIPATEAYDWKIERMTLPDGRPGVVCHFYDLSERQRYEEAVRASEEFTRRVLDNLFAFVGVMSPDGTLIGANRAPLEAAGIAATDVLGKKFWDCHWWSYDPAVQARLREAYERALLGEVVRYDVPVRMAGDSRMWIDFQLAPLRDAQGRITHLIPSAMDITVRRDAEQALRESERLLRTVIESTTDLVWVKDRQGRITLANQATFDLLSGGDPAGTLGRDVTSMVADEAQRRQIIANDESVMREGVTRLVEERFGPAGSPAIFESVKAPLRDETGRIVGIVGVSRDVTASRLVAQALRASEERYRAFVANSAEGVYRVEFDPPIDTSLPVDEQIDLVFRRARFAECNDAFARMYGMNVAADIIGQGFWMLDPSSPFTRSYFRAIIENGYRIAEAESVEKDAAGRDHIFANSVVGTVEGGRLLGAWGTQRDITDRRRSEEALAESEARFRTMADGLPFIVWVHDADGKLVFINQTYREFFGVTDQQVIGEGWKPLIHPDDKQAYVASFTQSIRERSPWTGQVRVQRHGSTEWRWIESFSRPRFGPDGTFLGVVGLSPDITERKRAEEALRESEARFRAVFEQAAIGIGRVAFDDARWIDVNDTLCRMLGYTREELLATRSTAITHPEDVALDTAPFRRMAAGELERYAVEKRFIHKSGRHVWASLTLSLVRDAQGRPDYQVCIVEDTTESREAAAELQRQADLLQALMDHVPIGIAIAEGQDVRIRMVSRAGVDLLQRSRAAVENAPLLAPVPAWQMYQADGVTPIPVDGFPLCRATRVGEVVRDEVYFLERPDGSRVPALCNAGPIRDLEGNVRGGIVTWVDISARRKTEEALQRSESEARRNAQELAKILDAVPAAVWIARDPACQYIAGNRESARLLRLPDGLNQSLSAPPDERPTNFRVYRPDGTEMATDELPLQAAVFTGKPRRGVREKLVFDDGSELTLFGHAEPIADEDGNTVGGVAAFIDISELNRAQEAVRRSEERLRAFFDSPSVGTLHGHIDGRVFSCNDEYLRIIGRSREQVLAGRLRWDDITPPEWLPIDAERIAEARRAGACAPYEKQYLRPDGSRVWVLVSYTLIPPDREESMALIIDISERKKLEHELTLHREHLQRLVDERTAELEASYQRLRISERMAALGTLAAGLGHDMGNLLMPLRVRIETLKSMGLPDGAIRELEGLRSAAGYLQKLASGLRLLAVDPVKPAHPEPTELRSWWAEAEPILKSALVGGITLEGGPPDEPLWIGVPRTALTQAVFNLVQNAGDAMRERGGGRVVVSARAEETRVAITISDDGPGMSDEVKRRCMEPFFTTKSRGISTGMGLALVYGLVNESGGAIELDSRLGRGTTFTLWFNAAPPAAAPAGPPLRAVVRIEDARTRAYVIAELKRLNYRVEDHAQGPDADLAVVDREAQGLRAMRVVRLDPRTRFTEVRSAILAAAPQPARDGPDAPSTPADS